MSVIQNGPPTLAKQSTRKRWAYWVRFGLVILFWTVLYQPGFWANYNVRSFIDTYKPSTRFVEVTNSNSVSQVELYESPVLTKVLKGLVWGCDEDDNNSRCSLLSKLHWLPVDMASGGRLTDGSAVILVNRQSNWLADFPGLAGAQAKLWYSYILWHELGHTFESDLKEAPTNPLFDKKKNPKNYQLYKEAHADIFALVGLARVEKGDVPALDRTGYEQFLKELIAWRRRSTDSIHATAPFLAQVTWEDIQATTESCMAESGGCRNEYAVSLDILEKVINRTRKMVHTAAVFRRT